MKQTSYIFLSFMLGLHLFAEDKKELSPTENLSTYHEAIDTWDSTNYTSQEAMSSSSCHRA